MTANVGARNVELCRALLNRLSCQLDCGGISIEPPRPMRWIPPCTSTEPVSGEIGSAEFSDKLSRRWPAAAQTHLVRRRVVRFLPRTQQLSLLSVPNPTSSAQASTRIYVDFSEHYAAQDV